MLFYVLFFIFIADIPKRKCCISIFMTTHVTWCLQEIFCPLFIMFAHICVALWPWRGGWCVCGAEGLCGTAAEQEGCWWQALVTSRLLHWSQGIWVISSLFTWSYGPLLLPHSAFGEARPSYMLMTALSEHTGDSALLNTPSIRLVLWGDSEPLKVVFYVSLSLQRSSYLYVRL